ncbi:hypothetical protein ACVXG7_29765 [Enterobacter hormaechei]
MDRSVKSLDSKLTIPMDMATELMTQIAKLEATAMKMPASWRTSR